MKYFNIYEKGHNISNRVTVKKKMTVDQLNRNYKIKNFYFGEKINHHQLLKPESQITSDLISKKPSVLI